MENRLEGFTIITAAIDVLMLIGPRSSDVGRKDGPHHENQGRGARMKLTGKKIGVLIESDFYEKEIFYYEHRFPEEGSRRTS